MRSLGLVLALGLVACTGDAPGGDSCIGATYDSCATEHDCTAGPCKDFPTQGFQVCTVSCGTTACPNDASGHPGTCDSTLQQCVPAMPNACVLAP